MNLLTLTLATLYSALGLGLAGIVTAKGTAGTAARASLVLSSAALLAVVSGAIVLLGVYRVPLAVAALAIMLTALGPFADRRWPRQAPALAAALAMLAALLFFGLVFHQVQPT